MKYIKSILFKLKLTICILLLGYFNTWSQSQAVLISESTGNSVMLKWYPSDYQTWELIMENGVSLTRYKIMDNGIPLNNNQALLTKMNLLEFKLPEAEAEWDLYPLNTIDGHQAAKAILYDPEFDVEVTGSGLAEAIELEESKENRYAFTLFIANRSMDLAKNMALAFEDNNLDINDTYQYVLSINDGNGNEIIDVTQAIASVSKVLNAPREFNAEGGDLGAVLSWKQVDPTYDYYAYNVEKSEDGVNFETVNDIPFTFSGDESSEQLSATAVFTDTLEQNFKDYHYRVRGISHFGTLSEPSETIVIQGKPAPMKLNILVGIDTVTFTSATIEWGGIDPSQEQYIDHFDIYKSDNPLEGMTQVNTSPLSPSTRSFHQEFAGIADYYIVTMIDIYGNYYKSNAILVQLKDAGPPEVPKNLSGVANVDGTIYLDWDDNFELDFKNYRIYRANLREGKFAEVTGSFEIKNSEFSEVLSLNNETDSVFYKLVASDTRGNFSEYSEIIGLARPDNVGPSNPLMANAFALGDGIYLEWEPSESGDVSSHKLERKPKASNLWEVILEFTPEDTSFYKKMIISSNKYNYVDNYELEIQEYNYRLLAYDHFGNVSSSEILSIFPFVSMTRGEIPELRPLISCINNVNTVIVNQQNMLNQSIQSINMDPSSQNMTNTLMQLVQQNVFTIQQYNYANSLPPHLLMQYLQEQLALINDEANTSNCSVDIYWPYTEEDDVFFHIYRAIGPSDMKEIAVIEGQFFAIANDMYKFSDYKLRPGHKHFYKIMAEHRDGTNSKFSPVAVKFVPSN